MSVVIDNISGSRVRMEITCSVEMFEDALTKAFDKIKDEVEIKGFRKGKVTRSVYETKFGVESLFEEAVNLMIGESYYNAVVENNVDVVAQPHVDFDPESIKRGVEFKFTAEVATKPEVTLGDYKGVIVEKLSDEVTEEEVSKDIDALITKNAELTVKEDGEILLGDTVVFDFDGYVDGEPFEGGKAENYELIIGSGQFIPGFEEQMVGLKNGDEKEVNVTFPKEYASEKLAGKPAVFKIKVHEIKEKNLPELNDEFVAELELDDVTTVDALKADTLEKLTKAKVEANKSKNMDNIIELVSSNATMEIPEDMITAEQNRMLDNTTQQAKQYGLDIDTYLKYSGMDIATYKDSIKGHAEKSLRYNLTIEAIGNAEKIEATEAEVDSKIAELAAQYNMNADQITQSLPRENIETEVKYHKTIDFLTKNTKFE